MIGGGFTSRTIFVYAEEKRKLVAYPSHHLPSDFHKLREDLIHDLELISTDLIGEVSLTKEAREWGEKWYEEHYRKLRENPPDERFASYAARKQTHLHKLAIIYAVSERHSLEIEKEDLIFAEKLLTAMEEDMPKVFDKIGQTKITRVVSEVLALLKAKRVVPIKEIYDRYHLRLNPSEISEAINGVTMQNGVARTVHNGMEVLTYHAI